MIGTGDIFNSVKNIARSIAAPGDAVSEAHKHARLGAFVGDGVRARAAGETVRAGAALQGVIALAAIQLIVARAAPQNVAIARPAAAAHERVVPRAAGQSVDPDIAADPVILAGTDHILDAPDHIALGIAAAVFGAPQIHPHRRGGTGVRKGVAVGVIGAAVYGVRARAARQGVVARAAYQPVIAAAPCERVVAAPAVDVVVARAAFQFVIILAAPQPLGRVGVRRPGLHQVQPVAAGIIPLRDAGVAADLEIIDAALLRAETQSRVAPALRKTAVDQGLIILTGDDFQSRRVEDLQHRVAGACEGAVVVRIPGGDADQISRSPGQFHPDPVVVPVAVEQS